MGVLLTAYSTPSVPGPNQKRRQGRNNNAARLPVVHTSVAVAYLSPDTVEDGMPVKW